MVPIFPTGEAGYALFATASISEAEVSEFCRNKGSCPHILNSWKQTCFKNMHNSPTGKSPAKEKKSPSGLSMAKKLIHYGHSHVFVAKDGEWIEIFFCGICHPYKNFP